ncbi:MAG: ATP-dependent helicase UvrD/PcrA [Patescibacteria group bacterium]|nr:ATP-dependent helicase UvrD/PcrA [Patescibacteria group bacterium]
MSHLDKLNPAQREAVETTTGPLLVLAGAGAGKTRVIAHRILEIVRRGTAPEHILAITFTNKAASEMRERVINLLSEARVLGDGDRPLTHVSAGGASRYRFSSHAPFVSTFHSLGLLIIKENAALLGFKRTPTIYDRADSLREMKSALKHFDESMEPRAALSLVSKTKGQGMTLSDFAAGARNYREDVVAKAWALYEEALRKDGALDFDDLLLRAMLLLRDNEAVRRHYQARWTYVHVDEYQDTNYVQARLLELLVGPEKHVCAVGDVDQTIYGWRGAEIKNIMSFERTFPGAKIVMLEENYRSTKAILQAANDVIAKNAYRPDKNLFTKNADGENLKLYQAFDELDEANFVARIVREGLAEGMQPRDFAVLYRANFQSRAVEEALLRADITYQVLGTRFFERKEVKDALSFVRAAILGTTADLGRIANTPPRGIGKVTLLKILAGQEASLTGKVREKVVELRTLLKNIAAAVEKLRPSELMHFVVTETGMERAFKEDKLEGAERLENIKELVSLAARYDDYPQVTDISLHAGLDAFLESAALASDQDELKDDANAVRLMTVHASKGLEFKAVFVTGLEEGLFPYQREGEADADKEEERRLMYVAITRAQKKLYLCYASYRTIFGAKTATLPSSFLSDIPGELIDLEAPERLGKTIYLD